ncbi:RagB/SusD family nutrient uptake outer membrane protein [Parapedobacter tibetensis]|uniref:RagB/SusD family nutrient uptake outer membrane protein n=1 Tax=Parapedobacter tibetensis TaxID=2972951 RepID=UPI00214DBA06|nr:RagB/SusD family nutrient uptake outer membrane protein [Parapedobacter tibetensis]
MKNTQRILIIFLSVLIFGCDHDLDPTVFSSVTEETYEFSEEDLQSTIGTVYASMRPWWNHQHFYMAQELPGDAIVMPANPSGWDDGGIYRNLHLHNWNSLERSIPNMWEGFYRGVFYSNRVIELIESGALPISAGKEAILSEMRVARAFFYWLIMDNFGNGPLVKSTSQDLPESATREEIYAFIVTEINESLPNLNEEKNSLMYGRFNKWAAKILLANVYLNSEVYVGQPNWEECLVQTDDIINSGKYALETNYSDVFRTDNEGSPEIVFAIPFDENLGTGFYIQRWSWHNALAQKYELKALPWGPGAAKGVTQFLNTYDSGDSRLESTWLGGQQFDFDGNLIMAEGVQLDFTKEIPNGRFTASNEGYRVNKFEVKQGSLANLSNDFPFFRYAEVLMIKAEALLRLGRTDEAAELVTQVRQRAFKDEPQQATVTGNELTQDSGYDYGYVEDYEITDEGDTSPVAYGRFLDELGWEFAWEAHRRRDMIRFGIFSTKSWLSHKPNGDHHNVFPIPQTALNANPNLSQNPGY